jgi:hypothetical protein
MKCSCIQTWLSGSETKTAMWERFYVFFVW